MVMLCTKAVKVLGKRASRHLKSESPKINSENAIITLLPVTINEKRLCTWRAKRNSPGTVNTESYKSYNIWFSRHPMSFILPEKICIWFGPSPILSSCFAYTKHYVKFINNYFYSICDTLESWVSIQIVIGDWGASASRKMKTPKPF